MIPSPSSSTTRSCVPPVAATKKAQDMPLDQSYFSPPSAYSTIPVTPSTATPNPTRVPPNSPTSAQTSSSSEQEMLSQFSAYFPPPPTPFLPPQRGSVPGPASPQISTSHRFPASGSTTTTDGPHPPHGPVMDFSSSANKHTLHVQLPLSIKPEMITISANRGDKLRVVTDAWHMQQEYHYEWHVSFPPRDVDMAAVQAKLEQNGHLFIEIRRLTRPY